MRLRLEIYLRASEEVCWKRKRDLMEMLERMVWMMSWLRERRERLERAARLLNGGAKKGGPKKKQDGGG